MAEPKLNEISTAVWLRTFALQCDRGPSLTLWLAPSQGRVNKEHRGATIRLTLGSLQRPKRPDCITARSDLAVQRGIGVAVKRRIRRLTEVNSSEIRAREAYTIGQPPRLLPLNPSEFGKEVSETVAALRQALPSAATDEVPEFIATMLRHPALFRRYIELGLQLFAGTLPVRDRELAILRTVWLCKTPYEWGEHVAIGKRVACLTAEEINRVREGSRSLEWNAHDRAIIRAVEELHEDAMISDEIWAVLARTLDDKQLIELLILVGQFHGAAYMTNSLRIRLIPGNPGLSAG
jgi:4-carboxymuconolactone decarboxylase